MNCCGWSGDSGSPYYHTTGAIHPPTPPPTLAPPTNPLIPHLQCISPAHIGPSPPHPFIKQASSEQPLPRHRTGQATAALQQEHLQHPLQHLQHPQQHLKHPLQHLQHPQQHLQHPQQHLQHPQQHLQHPQQHLQHQLLQQQQQLLLLQMYSGLPQSGVLPSYMALPYPTLQDLQLSYLPAQGMSLAPSSVPMVRPVPAVSTAADINMHLSGALQLAPSVTSLGPVPDMASVLPGASWIAPVPVFGSCIVNPFHPGILTTSWVK